MYFLELGVEQVEAAEFSRDLGELWCRVVCQSLEASFASVDLPLQRAPPGVGFFPQSSDLALGCRRASDDRAQLSDQRGIQRHTEPG